MTDNTKRGTDAANELPLLMKPAARVKRSEWDDAAKKRQSFNGWRQDYGDCDMELFTADQVREAQSAALAARPQPAPTIKYTPGSWFDARTVDEMQAFYLSRLPAIREAAAEHGYAIGVHGSLRRDFDLMAMQWRDGASDKDALAHAIAVAACGIALDGAYQWERKPNGRFAVSMPICWTDHSNPEFGDKPSLGHIDLSVIESAARPLLAVEGGDLDGERKFTAKAIADFVADNWSMKKYTLEQIETGLRSIDAAIAAMAAPAIKLPDGGPVALTLDGLMPSGPP